MYLPTFYKVFQEQVIFRCKRYYGYAPALGLWGLWAFWPSFYNMVYTDFIPPSRGVERRVEE